MFNKILNPSSNNSEANNDPLGTDCFSCRFTGFLVLSGFGSYLIYDSKNIPKIERSRVLGVRGVGLALVGLGLARLFYVRDNTKNQIEQ
ncbi:hypothetical protein CONCODRAFT_17186 [Conidiobolus coronatus NRRL 28638]|uniref:DUF4536 domain-containing protein n=1 Tax=Conidiobolus coronatus (strain ATCC 28846 / CBS 209.66 / NRRL 28638) TaxID=796925 RepID=A0A137P7S2_CONC2|nr:hypothetical protein CONCODRAFT_17186 [Conidiobolus coronatus NRRL 28638]|eukprot:KXN71019.1 hypothetical protein CONCODRAFT_17186 [Conidiobolus coronatus NRRL 28638]